MEPEPDDPAALVGRTWIPISGEIADGDAVVLIGSMENLLTEILLLWDTTAAGKPILKNSFSEERLFAWANLNPGTPGTYGLTVGIKDLTVTRPQTIEEIPQSWKAQREKFKNVEVCKKVRRPRGSVIQRDLFSAK